MSESNLCPIKHAYIIKSSAEWIHRHSMRIQNGYNDGLDGVSGNHAIVEMHEMLVTINWEGVIAVSHDGGLSWEDIPSGVPAFDTALLNTLPENLAREQNTRSYTAIIHDDDTALALVSELPMSSDVSNIGIAPPDAGLPMSYLVRSYACYPCKNAIGRDEHLGPCEYPDSCGEPPISWILKPDVLSVDHAFDGIYYGTYLNKHYHINPSEVSFRVVGDSHIRSYITPSGHREWKHSTDPRQVEFTVKDPSDGVVWRFGNNGEPIGGPGGNFYITSTEETDNNGITTVTFHSNYAASWILSGTFPERTVIVTSTSGHRQRLKEVINEDNPDIPSGKWQAAEPMEIAPNFNPPSFYITETIPGGHIVLNALGVETDGFAHWNRQSGNTLWWNIWNDDARIALELRGVYLYGNVGIAFDMEGNFLRKIVAPFYHGDMWANGAAYGNGIFAVSCKSSLTLGTLLPGWSILISNDKGVTWKVPKCPWESRLDNCIIFNENNFIIFPNTHFSVNKKVYMTSDFKSWEVHDLNLSEEINGLSLTSVTYGGGMYFAFILNEIDLNDYEYIPSFSSDGILWEPLTQFPDNFIPDYDRSGNYSQHQLSPRDVVINYCNGEWIFLCQGNVAISNDLKNWTIIPVAPTKEEWEARGWAGEPDKPSFNGWWRGVVSDKKTGRIVAVQTNSDNGHTTIASLDCVRKNVKKDAD